MHEEQNRICGLHASFGTFLKENMHENETIHRHGKKYFNFTKASLRPGFPINLDGKYLADSMNIKPSNHQQSPA
jgi:hypothetical protein